MPSESAVRDARRTELEPDDVRRARGALSCAECQRLKLKCNKQVPCSTCVRRRCEHLCPNQVMSTGHSTRLISAQRNSEKLRDKIKELTQRIHQLEDALALLQSTISTEVHPLLTDKHRVSAEVTPDAAELENRAVTNALGSLTIRDREQTFFGQAAGSEALFMHAAATSPHAYEPEADPITSDAISRLCDIFPFLAGGAWRDEHALFSLLELLPDVNRASALSDIYFTQTNWSQRVIEQEEFAQELMDPLYAYMSRVDASPSEPIPLSAHQVAVVFSVFSLGALLDLSLPARNTEAEGYHQLARAAIYLRTIYSKPEIATVRALSFLGSYHHIAANGVTYTIDSAWRLHSFACKVGESMGLHRDPARWGLEPKIVQRRRMLFWELYATDSYFSMATGRPPSFSKMFIDCAKPEDHDKTINQKGDIEPGFTCWRHTLSEEVQTMVVELTQRSPPPPYDAVLKLDERIRSYQLPSSLDPDAAMYDPSTPPVHYLKNVHLSLIRSIVTMYLHRSFFTQALLDHPVNPLRSKYAPSFLATSRAASDMIKMSKRNLELYPDLCIRWWHFHTQVFSAAIIMGSIVIRIPASSIAGTALHELGIATDLFAAASNQLRNGQQIQALLVRLQTRALQVYQNHRSGASLSNAQTVGFSPKDDDELAIFGGYTRVHRVESNSAGSPSSASSPATTDERHYSEHRKSASVSASPSPAALMRSVTDASAVSSPPTASSLSTPPPFSSPYATAHIDGGLVPLDALFDASPFAPSLFTSASASAPTASADVKPPTSFVGVGSGGAGVPGRGRGGAGGGPSSGLPPTDPYFGNELSQSANTLPNDWFDSTSALNSTSWPTEFDPFAMNLNWWSGNNAVAGGAGGGSTVGVSVQNPQGGGGSGGVGAHGAPQEATPQAGQPVFGANNGPNASTTMDTQWMSFLREAGIFAGGDLSGSAPTRR